MNLKLQEEIIKGMKKFINSKLKNGGNCDYRMEGCISKVNSNGTYDVIINKDTWQNIHCRAGLESYLKEGIAVEFLLVNGDSSKLKIDDILH